MKKKESASARRRSLRQIGDEGPWPRHEAGDALGRALARAITDREFRDRCLVSKVSAKKAVQELITSKIPDEVEIQFTTLDELCRIFVLQVPDFELDTSSVPADMSQYVRCALGLNEENAPWRGRAAEQALNDALRRSAVDHAFRDRCLASRASAKKAVAEAGSVRIPGEVEIQFMTLEELHRMFILEMPEYKGGDVCDPSRLDKYIRCCWPIYEPVDKRSRATPAQERKS